MCSLRVCAPCLGYAHFARNSARRLYRGNAETMDGENTGMSAATETENPLERGRWAGEKSRVRESIVAPIDEWREENVKGREPENDFWTVAG